MQINADVLQYQNQQLMQQLEAHKNQMHDLENKLKGLKEKQKSYDQTLITTNRIWKQLNDDLVLLGIRGGGDAENLKALDHDDCSADMLEACSAEEIFLYRFIKSSPHANSGENGTENNIQEALLLRHSYTIKLMKQIEETVESQRAKTESLALALHGSLSSEDTIMQFRTFDESMRVVANSMRRAIDVLHEKHKQYADEINNYANSNLKDELEIKRLSGELEEVMAELEESRRKLVALQMQKHGTSLMNVSVTNDVNMTQSSDSNHVDNNHTNSNHADKALDLQELKESVEEAETLADSRRIELQKAEEENFVLSEQLDALQNELKDDNHVASSKPYTVINDRVQYLQSELVRCRGLIETLQTDRNHMLRKEVEIRAKADSADAVKMSFSNFEAKIEELEFQIQKVIPENNDVEFKVEEAMHNSGRKDIKDEIHVMASALNREMQMMESQLNRCKEAACEVLALREQANSLRSLLDSKNSEHKTLSNRCTEQMMEIKSLKALIRKLEKEKHEQQFLLDMYGQEHYDNRTLMEMKESEQRARAQVKILQATLDEHSLELRVRAANEAEEACQQRLSLAEAEMADLREKVDASQRHLLEIKEAIRIKDAEATAYITEIETIGQAYEDMQAQNQHLLQQVADRDNYNIKLVSDSVKMKQSINFLLNEKQAKETHLNQNNASMDLLKQRITRGEEQMKQNIFEAIKASSENIHVSGNLEKTKLDLAEAERRLKWAKYMAESSDMEYEQNQKRILDLNLDLENEREETRKLEEVQEEVKYEVRELSSESEEAAIQRLQEEIKECKSILKCGVCFDRPKEVVITKCFHLFCQTCIQRNLETRHRKCPGCGTAFGQSDVREVNI